MDESLTIHRRKFLGIIAGYAALPACGDTAIILDTSPHPEGHIHEIDRFISSGDDCDGRAINRAIDHAHEQGGGIVLLDSREYKTSVPISLKSRVRLRGRGKTRTRIRQTGTPEAWSRFSAGAIISTRNEGVYESIHIEDLSLQGAYPTPIPSDAPFFAKNGIAILNARNSSIQRCAVSDVGTGMGFFGRAAKGPHRNLISDCTVRNASSWVGLGNPGTPRGITMATDYSTISNCVVDASHTGYYVATEHGVYRNCVARGWRDDGFYVNANFCHLDRCQAIAADKRVQGSGSGFAVNPSHHNLFTGCEALRCPNSGMRFRHAGKMAPTDNRVVNCSFIDCGYGFLDDMIGTDPYPAAVARRNEFTGNTARDCQLCGFLFIRETDGIFRKNRAISNNRGGVTAQHKGGIAFAEYCLNNVIEDNECDDPEKVKTQKWGLYIYPQSVTRASVANVGNRIRHRSKYGIDVI